MKIGQKFYLTRMVKGIQVGVCQVSVFKHTYRSFRVYNKDMPEIGRLIFNMKSFKSEIHGEYQIHQSRQSFLDQAEETEIKADICNKLQNGTFKLPLLKDILLNLLDN